MAKKKEESIIKNLDGFIKPEFNRNENGTVVSVGMINGQNYYTYNTLRSGLMEKPRTFDESYHFGIGNFRNYLNDIVKLIENNQIYVKYVAPPVVVKEPEIKEHQNQISLF